jgi:hypothetical protein
VLLCSGNFLRQLADLSREAFGFRAVCRYGLLGFSEQVLKLGDPFCHLVMGRSIPLLQLDQGLLSSFQVPGAGSQLLFQLVDVNQGFSVLVGGALGVLACLA